MGRVSTKVLMAFLADHSVLQDVTLEGHLFQALDASLRKVDCRMSVFPNSTSNPLETALVTQGVVSWLTHFILSGKELSFVAFHTSEIFI